MVALVVATGAWLLLPVAPASGGPIHPRAGTSGFSFLKIGVGARAEGMGGAFAAVADDATGQWWNPAGPLLLSGGHLVFVRNEWFQGIEQNFFGAAGNFGDWGLGAGMSLTSVEGIERRTSVPTERPLGFFSSHDVLLGLSYARWITGGFGLGIALKGLYEKIYVETASAISGDLGAVWRPGLRNLTVAAAMQNLMGSGRFVTQTLTPPRLLRAGAAYALFFPGTGNRLTLALDVEKPGDGFVTLRIGGECTYRDRLALRAGALGSQTRSGFAGGFGLRAGRYHIDYALAPCGALPVTSHRISLGVTL